MTKPSILKPEESYTFSQYFDLKFDLEDILAELGFTLERSLLNLTKQSGINYLDLKYRLEQKLALC